LPYGFQLSSIRSEAVVIDLLHHIDQIVAGRDYERIIIVGHSLGALIARRLFLVAAGNPPGFQSEKPLLCENPRAWASLVDRLVTLGAFNRGWQVSGRMGWYYSFLLNLVGLIGHLSPNNWRPTIFDMRLGAPFIVQTRLHWLAYRRWHQKIRREKNYVPPHRQLMTERGILCLKSAPRLNSDASDVRKKQSSATIQMTFAVHAAMLMRRETIASLESVADGVARWAWLCPTLARNPSPEICHSEARQLAYRQGAAAF
jgi:pimeloyl-ACP methyl ester carboxylesterase